jgi:hypothetical protein
MSEESNVTTPQPEVPANAQPGGAQPADAWPGGAVADAPAPDAVTPDAVTPDAVTPDAVTPDAPGPRGWFRRRPLIAGFGAGILAAAVIAAVVLIVVRPGGQSLRYTGMPAPCITVTAASLAKYMPDATSSPLSRPSSSTDQEGACSWSSITDGQDRNLLVVVDVFGSSSGLTKAQQAYMHSAAPSNCCKNLQVSMPPVTGLGDQARALLITPKPAGTSATAPGISLVVRSGNADVELFYSDFPIGSARPSVTPAAELAGAIAMGRDVLAALANPAAAASAAATSTAVSPTAASSPAASSPPPGPKYASPRDACTLVKAATLARYAPGAAANKIPAPSSTVPGAPQLGNCSWAAPNGSIVLEVTIDPDSATAQQGYEFGVQFAHQNGTGATFHGAQAVTGVGQQATAIFQTLTGNFPSVDLYVWSGNAELQVSVTDLPFSTPLSRATKLAADIAMARDVLADLPT